MRKTKTQKQMEAAVTKAYSLVFNGVPVNMTDIPKIYKAIERAIQAKLAGGDVAAFAATLKELRAVYGE